MAENNSSATLLPCPFCGASARLMPSTRGDYTSIVCNSPCAGPLAIVAPNDQIEAGIAAWNTRAPLKTAEGAYPALPKPDYPAQFDGHGGEQSSDESYSAEQMRAYAAQAVAAQAAPAAVAVPGEREALKRLEAACDMRAQLTTPEAYKAIGACKGMMDALEELDEARRQARAALAATPALPATEDSSAGDLAEHGMNYTDAYAGAREDLSIWKRRALEAERDLRAERKTTSRLVAEMNAANGPTHLGEAVRKAEVQAEPVVLQMCSDLKPRTDSEKAAYLAGVADGRMYAERDADTAPQAQPADALELAKKFHEVYERLAPNFGYETRSDTKQFDPSSPNGRLMTSVIQEVITALGSDTQVDPIRQLIHKHAALVAENESAYFELCYHRATGWMAWITDRPLCMPPVINPGRKVIAQGQGDTAEEACSDAMAAAQEGGKA